MMRSLTFIICALIALPCATQAQSPPQSSNAPYAYRQLDDPRQEADAKALMETLRCLTCQSQSIADSDAPIAGDMRHQVRVKIAAGEKPEEVRAWLMQRYGNYVSYAPVVNVLTWPLFVVPLLLLAAAFMLWRHRMRARS